MRYPDRVESRGPYRPTLLRTLPYRDIENSRFYGTIEKPVFMELRASESVSSESSTG